MKLVIAEKKSVATAIAQALCAAPVQRDGCYECGQLLVTWAQGHLIDLAMPRGYTSFHVLDVWGNRAFLSDEKDKLVLCEMTLE